MGQLVGTKVPLLHDQPPAGPKGRHYLLDDALPLWQMHEQVARVDEVICAVFERLVHNVPAAHL